jgi:hypothetical protein
MLVACQLAGLSALEAYYAGVDAHAQLIDHLDRAPARATRDSHPVLFELEAKGRRLAFVSAPRGGGSDLRRPLHDDKACAFQMLHKPLGDDLGHEFVGVVDALTTLIAECEGERRGKVGQVCVRELVGVGHRRTIVEERERTCGPQLFLSQCCLLSRFGRIPRGCFRIG